MPIPKRILTIDSGGLRGAFSAATKDTRTRTAGFFNNFPIPARNTPIRTCHSGRLSAPALRPQPILNRSWIKKLWQ